MKKLGQIIFIDDDEVNNIICERISHKTLGTKENIFSFVYPEEGLEHIVTASKIVDNDSQILLFLDINMPLLNGWDVLDLIEEMEQSVKEKLIIIMLSSSIDPTDRAKAENNKLVSEFIEKPLTANIIVQIMKNYNIPIPENKI